MSRSKKQLILWSAIGLLAGVLAESAQAQVVINGAGSSAGRQFAGGAPIAICDPAFPATHFRSGSNDSNSNFHTWSCTATVPGVGSTPVVIRYAASESGDGFVKLTGQGGASTSAAYILDQSTCPGAGVPRTVAGLNFTEFSSCATGGTDVVHFGASDVLAASFGQTGPGTTNFPDPLLTFGGNTITQNTSDVVAALPFAFFVNNAVRKSDSAGNATATQLGNLSRAQVEGIFRRNVRTWNDLGGYTVAGGASDIVLCLREAGSGSKAALDQTMMLQTSETSNAVPGIVIFSPTSSGVATCVQNNLGAIGYLNAETTVPNAHPINFAGYSPNYATGTTFERKRDVACGRYEFWTFWRIIRKTAGVNLPSAAQNSLITLFVNSAKNEVNNVPSGSHWVAVDGSVPDEMKVTKSADAGPISWVAGPHNACAD